MNSLAAHEFTLRSKSSRRDFLLQFCQEDFDLASDISENEKQEDKSALAKTYKSVCQAAMRKKMISMT